MLYDASGGTWVYEARDGGMFVRQRVEIGRRRGGHGRACAKGHPGTRVVTVGAAELFGTEFGAGK